jgi:hypothetical protein
MSAKHDDGELHELAGGWITERKGTPVPAFLKLTYVGFCVFGVVYLLLYGAGEVAHATRGPLVQQLNALTGQPGAAWFGLLLVLLVAYTAGLLVYALRAREE